MLSHMLYNNVMCYGMCSCVAEVFLVTRNLGTAVTSILGPWPSSLPAFFLIQH